MREIFTWLLKCIVILKAIWKVIQKDMSIYCWFSICFVMHPLGKSWKGTLECCFLVLTYGVNNFLQWEEIVVTTLATLLTLLCLKQRVTLDSFPAFHLSQSTLDVLIFPCQHFCCLSPNNGFGEPSEYFTLKSRSSPGPNIFHILKSKFFLKRFLNLNTMDKSIFEQKKIFKQH